jgi:arabinan endo-1,5-alpha-L-arabinosidase
MQRQLLTKLAATALAAIGGTACAQQPAQAPRDTLNSRLAGDLTPTHDPVIIREGDTYHVFSTGHGKRLIETRTSTDLVNWKAGDPVFTALPGWATQAIPGSNGMWAPDISFVNGRYRLYYSVSTFGSNRSAIGLATAKTLDRASPDYGWRDEGLVVLSSKEDDYNAIDPNFVIDREGRHWLTLGSFWTGIKLFELDRRTGKPLNPKKPVSIHRPPPRARRRSRAGGSALHHRPWRLLLADGQLRLLLQGREQHLLHRHRPVEDDHRPLSRQGWQRHDAGRRHHLPARGLAGAAALARSRPCRLAARRR